MKKMADGGFPVLTNTKSKSDTQTDASRIGMAEGGDVDDDKMLMNHMMMEHMDAIHSKDVTKAHDSLRAMVSQMVNQMDEGDEE